MSKETTATKTETTSRVENHTNVWLILDESTMETVTQTIALNNGFAKNETPMMFETRKEADDFASENLECWTILNSQFRHSFIHHRQNVKPEIVKIERGNAIDTDSQALNVKIRFGKWFMDFAWTINNRTNWVHTNEDPTHLDGIEIDDDSFQIVKDANAIMFDFKFEATKIGEEIEERKHMIQ